MKLQGKIGFLGGGRMAEALIKGILQAGLTESSRIIAIDPDKDRRYFLEETFAISTGKSHSELADSAIVILAVKPQIMGRLLEECAGWLNSRHLVISIAAGIPIAFIAERLNAGCRIIRVMPNTPALVLEGASALSGGANTTSDDMETASHIFSAIGKSLVLPENYLDAVTGLSGSGPAYVFMFIDALIDGGVKVGLSRQDAEILVLQTVLGSVRLALETGKHPALLKAMVTSPGGTTIAGLHELEKAGFKAGIMTAVEAATRRSEELGKLVVG
ncbi:MAG: pyrroline-5-carboxylate reductase [Proteobacteria bacterium]|nr:pyrroline-5-carboxylate reductase [Pseudomonadota bacterium]MBU4296285.1 pyrroline-5-carboxylate reductase [Pseudomonadota bacterium]MCG2748633.1 pyrroline-5-carboxylate reductase [Desulfobulbaceae bacterium]